eukprot:1016795-Pelagomonas_calceolata.AAC.7
MNCVAPELLALITILLGDTGPCKEWQLLGNLDPLQGFVGMEVGQFASIQILLPQITEGKELLAPALDRQATRGQGRRWVANTCKYI